MCVILVASHRCWAVQPIYTRQTHVVLLIEHVTHLILFIFHFRNLVKSHQLQSHISSIPAPFRVILFLNSYKIMYYPLSLFSSPLNHGLALKHLLNLSFYAPRILQLLQNFTTPFLVLFRPTPFKNPSKNISPSLFLHFFRIELDDKVFISFS